MQGKDGMLYPLMVIAAVSVILLSMVSIATMTGHIPSVVLQKFDWAQRGAVPSSDADAPAPRTMHAAVQNDDALPATERKVPIAVKRIAITAPQSALCSNCGIVQSIIAEEVTGKGMGAGAVTRGVVDQQLGGGPRRAVASAGAPGGSYAGNETEKTIKTSMRYVIRVRMEDGTTRVISETVAPALSAGQRVRIDDGLLGAAS